MELTVDQALQEGVAAHKEGKFQDAERLYRAILQAQPNHPDANHNLGVLAVAVGKPLEAIPLFKRALVANPQIEQFWLSYIDALIKLERFDEAKLVLVEGERAGVSSDKLDVIEQRLKSRSSGAAPPQDQLNHLLALYQASKLEEAEVLATSLTLQFPRHPFGWRVLGAVLKQTGRLAESLALIQEAVTLSPRDAEAQHQLALTLKELGRLDEAEASYRQAIGLEPDNPSVHNNLANTLKELGRLDEAEASYRQALALEPGNANVYNNLGNTLNELGRLGEAEASYRQAINLKPDLAEAHYNLGNTLREVGRLKEAEASYRQAIVLKPDFAKTHSNLGNTLRELGRLGESISSYARAINLKTDFDNAYSNLGSALKGVRFNKTDPSLYPILINLLSKGNFVRPKNVARPILSLIRLDNLIEEALLNTTTFTEIKEVDQVIKVLAHVPLLHQLMRICPLPDLQLEASFVSMRRVLLTDLEQVQTSPEVIHFLSTLSLHCFTNEYVYFETEEEVKLISALEAAIAESIAQASQPTITETMILATYRPLHQYDWIGKLKVLDQLPEVKERLVEEPLAERVLAENMPIFSHVDDDVSRKVREQYEESPYPRWVKLAIPSTRSVAEVCNEAKLQLHSENIKNVSAPSILIAGCGTGQHSIETACHFANCKVTAVDLSRASLAYAQRKTRDLGIANIEYLHADILNLGELGREFDIIESAGVLHHMDDPMAGWRVLVDLLKTGGLMYIGLYSELARRPVVKTREDIALMKIGASKAEIRQFRKFLVESHEEHHQQITGAGDFFSLSVLRDFIFHVQEHRFTIPQIRKCLEELGLKFCGFAGASIIAEFEEFVGENADIRDLSLWHQFEKTHPSAFEGMYQFWCQKL